MKKLLMIPAALFLICCMAAPVFSQSSITIATLDWQPYIGQDLDNYGYVGELVAEAFSRSGITPTFNFYPWNRVVNLAEQGKVGAYGPEYYAAELDQRYIFSDPFPGGPAGLIAMKSRNITYNTLNDLSPYRIGVVRGYVNEANFDAATYLNKEEATDDLTNIRKLLGGRIDLFFCDKLVLEYLATQEGLDTSQMELVKTMAQHDLYLCFPRQLSNAQAMATAFNKGLAEMKADGTYQKILEKHGF